MTFLHHDDAQFKIGTIWHAKDGSGATAKILSVKLWPRCSTGRHWYWDVDYLTEDGKMYEKDVWNFQTRYAPQTA